MCLTIYTGYERIMSEEKLRELDNFTHVMFPDSTYKRLKENCQKVAEEDIVCYKIMTKEVKYGMIRYGTPFRGYIMEMGKTYETVIDEDFFGNTDRSDNHKMFVTNLASGLFHTFINREDAEAECIHFPLNVFYQRGYVSPMNKNNFHIVSNVVVECIIPKGTTYYKGLFDGEYDSYGSKAIMMKGEVKKDNCNIINKEGKTCV